jgi:hypothetical protein
MRLLWNFFCPSHRYNEVLKSKFRSDYKQLDTSIWNEMRLLVANVVKFWESKCRPSYTVVPMAIQFQFQSWLALLKWHNFGSIFLFLNLSSVRFLRIDFHRCLKVCWHLWIAGIIQREVSSVAWLLRLLSLVFVAFLSNSWLFWSFSKS